MFKYRLLLTNGTRQNAANELIGLWADLDEYTRIGEAVVIVDTNDEVRAGNLLGMQQTIEQNIFYVSEVKE